MDGMNDFDRSSMQISMEAAERRGTVRSALLLTIVSVSLTLGIIDGIRMVADPPIVADPIQYAPLGW